MTVSTKSILVSVFASLALLFGQTAAALCLDDATVAKLVAGYPTTPVTGLPADLSLEDAYCTQAKYVALLRKDMGEPVGYKVGFTGKATQDQFGIPEVTGEVTLTPTRWGIKPFKALMGAIKLKDRVLIRFDLPAAS